MRRILFVTALAAPILLFSPHVRAQTTAVGPYYATPSWDQRFTCATQANCSRFVVLANWDNQAVLDRETGLVWEREPNAFPFEQSTSWSAAQFACFKKTTGGRKGWRLPTEEELGSLLDETSRLPPGHPFINVRIDPFAVYWSATTVPTQLAYVQGFAGSSGLDQILDDIRNSNSIWCVRGSGGTSY
jgi:hypothetical protein